MLRVSYLHRASCGPDALRPRAPRRRRTTPARLAAALALLGAALLPGCTPDFEEAWQVTDLRILAIQADPAEALGTRATLVALPPVHVTALVVDPRAPDAAVDWELWACSPEQNTCDDAAARVLVKRARTAPAAIAADFAITPALLATAIQKDTLRGFGGVPVKVHLKVSGPRGSDEGIKRLVYGLADQPLKTAPAAGTLRGTCRTTLPSCDDGLSCERGSCLRLPNRNPAILRLTADDKPLDATRKLVAGQKVKLYPETPAGEAEAYWVYTFEGGTRQREEYLSYSFFATSGKLSNANTGGRPSVFITRKSALDLSSSWTPAEAGRATLWLVVRDDRGGVSWVSHTVQVTAAPKSGS